MQEASNSKEVLSLVMWIGGAAVAAWNGLLTLFLVSLSSQAKETRESIKTVSVEREDHCIPRMECERTHAGVEKELSEIRKGIDGVNLRLDKIYQDRH